MTKRHIRFIQRARELVGERFTSLMGMLFAPDELRASFERQGKNKAPGVDGVRTMRLVWMSESLIFPSACDV